RHLPAKVLTDSILLLVPVTLIFVGLCVERRWLRKLLRDAMESEGFAVYEYEWWHFDYRDVLRYPVLNFSLEDLCRSRPDRQPMGVFG
ncbi:hypothetical protein GR268_48075, partial [Rhizobium leguminosarum]|nr:hypothetical protein [Rhizobium leguminosarum]